jgi:tRNA threonylcarbamoyladenosine biosynthesis protein TsaB
MLLAIDTATRSMSLALHDGQVLLAEQTCVAGKQQNSQLAPTIDYLTTMCGITLADLKAVAVCQGPGSYTGLRVGVALAKGIATTARLPLVGITTLDIVAAGVTECNTRATLIAAVQAGRGRIIAAHYQRKANQWFSKTDPQITTWASLMAGLEAGTYFITGEIDDKAEAAMGNAPDGVVLKPVSVSNRARRAGNLAELALAMLKEAGYAQEGQRPEKLHEAFHPMRVLPIYLKSPDE